MNSVSADVPSRHLERGRIGNNQPGFKTRGPTQLIKEIANVHIPGRPSSDLSVVNADLLWSAFQSVQRPLMTCKNSILVIQMLHTLPLPVWHLGLVACYVPHYAERAAGWGGAGGLTAGV